MDVNNNGIVDSNDKFLNGQLTKYGIWSGKVLPEILKFTKEESVYESRVEYLSYDNYGNPTEVRQTDGTTVTYLWGYNGQYPVAKIANATYPEVINTGVDLAVLESISSSESAFPQIFNRSISSSVSGRGISTLLSTKKSRP